jgi:hypothetical protein
MKRLPLIALVLCALSGQANAKPRKTTGVASNCPSGKCQIMPRWNTSTAQGVAEIMAERGVMAHLGGNSGYEGVGMGMTPEQALSNCCYSRSGMSVIDQGVARGRDGRFYACKRYR